MHFLPSDVELPNQTSFGYGSFKPQKLQKLLNNAKAFLLFLTLANIIQGITINGLLKVNVTSIERRFNLLSSESGLIISSYDIAGCLTLLPISYLGGRGHKPRWIGIGLMVTSVGMMTLALPHFITGPYVYSTTISTSSENENSSACLQPDTHLLQDTDALCAERSQEPDTSSSFALNNMKYVFMLGQFLIGAGSTPFAALSLTFLDDSVDPMQYPIYIGVYYLGALIGPAAGFILGGKLLQTFTELDVTPTDITVQSPQWVGAWWIGFVICSIGMLFIAVPILGFPRQLRSTLTRQHTLSDFKDVPLTPKPSYKSSARSGTEVIKEKSATSPSRKSLSAKSSATEKKEQELPLMEMQTVVPVAPSESNHQNNSDAVVSDTSANHKELNSKTLSDVSQSAHQDAASARKSASLSPDIPHDVARSPTIQFRKEHLSNGELPEDTTFAIFRSTRTLHVATASSSHETLVDIFSIFFKDLVKILTNKAFISLSLAAAVLGTIVSGFSTFGPKFIESQFSRTASDAANVFGYIFLPASAVGLLLGSFLMSGLKLRHKKALLTCFIVSALGLCAQLIIALSCEDIDFAGITVPYDGDSSVTSTPPRSLESSCNEECLCPFNAFDPVCGGNGVTYYSPCHASCHSRGTGTQPDFSNCTCITSSRLNAMQSSTTDTNEASSAQKGKCMMTCRWQSLILTSLFFVVATTFMCAIPGADLSLRCFQQHSRSLSVGVQWILIRTLGTIPGPIVFGSMIDSTCVLWNKIDPCVRGQGSCVMYRNHELSFSMLILSMIFKGASVLFFGAAWLTYVPAALMTSQVSVTPSRNSASRRKSSVVEPSVDT